MSIVLSFDHELPLGGLDVSYEESLLGPTDQLLDLADELGVPIVLFADVLCAQRFREWDRSGFYEPYCHQLDRALRRGHDVQLHLHPHWIDTEYHDGRFHPSGNYKLADFAQRESWGGISGIVSSSVEWLTGLAIDARSDYACVAYRAGGYVLEPEAGPTMRALWDAGIRIDSSIAKGFYRKSAFYTVDYRKMPRSANWFIGLDGDLRTPADSGLYEVPIAVRPKNPITNLPTRFKRKALAHRARPLGGRGFLMPGSVGFLDKVRHAFSPRMLTFDIYTMSVNDLLGILEHTRQRHCHDESIALSSIAHPKTMSAHSFELLRGFVERTRAVYGDEVRFCSYQDLAREIAPIWLDGRDDA